MRQRGRNLVVRLAEDELAMARALAEDRDEPFARVVRKWIRDAYVERFGVNAPQTGKVQ